MLCDLKPGGRYVAADLHQAGGVPVVVKRLQEMGRLNEDAMTVTGRTVGEHAAEAQETEGQQVVRPLDDPIKATGGLAILRGNLAPDGCVVKLSGHERVHAQGPGARVRGRGGTRWPPSQAGGDQGRRRRRHPQRGPRRRPRDARDAGGHRRARGAGARRRRRAHHRRALLRRHPRLHGRPRRPRGGPRRPDHRGPGRRHGDDRRRRPAASTSTCPTTRSPAASRPTSSRRPTATNGVFGKYAKLVSSASEGAVTR